MVIKPPVKKVQKLTQKAIKIAEHFMHIEASSGIMLLVMSLAALYLANSNWQPFYEDLWHTKLGFHLGSLKISWDLHFWVNDVLMTFFFLVVGMEIKQEVIFGALSNIRQALLPIIAAIGGVLCPALIFFFFNKDLPTLNGWAIPTATDIAFAVGILALLGKSIPHNVRIVLLSLAIIDDIIAILIITFVYSQNIDFTGLYLVLGGLFLVLLFQQMGLDFAPLYLVPGAILWFGLFKTGIHPTIAGVILGFLTPTKAVLQPSFSMKLFEDFFEKMAILYKQDEQKQNSEKIDTVKKIETTTRHMVAPSERVQYKLHAWVAFLIMPLFAFANAGVNFSQLNFNQHELSMIFVGILLGLFVGKPVGIFFSSFLAVKLKLCQLPKDVNWRNIFLIGMLAGIGFTMAIFVTLLAFEKVDHINIAKIAVLIASGASAVFGLGYGLLLKKISSSKAKKT